MTYDYINDYIYINVGDSGNFNDLGAIVVEAPFEKPEIVDMESESDGHYKINDDDEYFLPEDMIDGVKKIVLNTWNLNVVRDTNQIPTPNLVQ